MWGGGHKYLHSLLLLLLATSPTASWRGRLQLVLHSHYFHTVIVVLVIIDVLVVLFELLLDVGAFGE